MDTKETTLFTAILISSVIVGTIIFYFAVSMIQQHRRNMQLTRQNILAEITAIDQDRTRIAADLHDEFGPSLSAIKMKLDSLELPHPEDRAELERTKKHIDEMVHRMREISFDLMPQTLVRKGLVTALDEFVRFLGKKNALAIAFESDPDFSIPEATAIALYRMTQEIIHNTLRHSQARHLTLSIKREKDQLVLSSLDDGIGFDYAETAAQPRGLGLRNLFSRTELMGGTIRIESRIGKGTAYLIKIPLT